MNRVFLEENWILAIEGYEHLRFSIGSRLGELLGKSEVIFASNVSEATELIASIQTYDIIVLGISTNATKASVAAELACLRKYTDDTTKYVLFTGFGLDVDGLGFSAIAKKPDIPALAEAIRPLLRTPRSDAT